VKASDLGLNPGDQIAGFLAGTAQSSDALNIGTGATTLYDSMPNSLSYMSPYTVGHSFDCDVIYRNGFE